MTPTTAQPSPINISPYEIPHEIWKIVSKHFERRWNIAISHAFPKNIVDRPTVVYRIFRRIPGTPNKGQVGYSYTNIGDRVDDTVPTTYSQRYTMEVDFYVFCRNPKDCDEISWELESAVTTTQDRLAQRYPGLTVTFVEQLPDLTESEDTEMFRRRLRFEVRCEINVTVPEIPLEVIEIQENFGFRRSRVEEKVDTEVAPTYTPPLPSDGIALTKIGVVEILYSTGWRELFRGTDYVVEKAADDTPFIRWLETGKKPVDGERFRVEFEYVPHRRIIRSSTASL